MVTQFLKDIFLTNSATYSGFPNFTVFLPSAMRDLYFDYYGSGTGAKILLIFLVLILLPAMFSKQFRLRYFSRTALLLICSVYGSSTQVRLANTEIQLSAIGFPIPRISTQIVYFIFFVATIQGYYFVRKLCNKNCRKVIVYTVDASFILLFLMFLLPFWSGELFSL